MIGLGELVERAVDLDARLRDLTVERDGVRARVNELSKEVGRLRRAGDDGAAEALQLESRELGDREKALDAEHDALSGDLRELLLVIPNIPHPDAPDGRTDADNPVVKGPFNAAMFADHQRVPHW